jgi:hypothetical protein
MTALWSATAASVPDHWTVVNGALTLDSTFRRFGVKSMKVVTQASLVCKVTPWADAVGVGILVSGGTTYTWSTYVNTLGVVLPDWVQLAVFDAAGVLLHSAPVGAGERGATKDSSAAAEGWERLYTTFKTPEGVERVFPAILLGGTTVQEVRLDAHQLEEGSVASGWRPGLTGQAVVVDVGGLAVDAKYGGTLRLRGSTAGLRDVIELGTNGLKVGGPTSPVELHSPQASVLHVHGARLTQMAKPSNPAAGTGILYASTTPDVRFLLPDGTETVLGSGGTHPDLATHNTLGLATQAELDAAVASLSPVFCGMRNEATTQSFATGTASLVLVTLTAGGTSTDPHGFFDFANNQLVVPSGLAGWYLVTFEGEWASNATGARRASIRKNAANSTQTWAGTTTNQPFTLPVFMVDYLAVGDIINFYVAQSSGANLVLQKKSFSMRKLD